MTASVRWAFSGDEQAVLGVRNGRFCALLSMAEQALQRGDHAAAAGVAQLATHYAFPAGVGLFGSPRLERLLQQIGRQIPSGPGRARQLDGDRRRVLHVLTYAKPIGGDSRFAWRWMELDRDSRHSAVITSQWELDHLHDIPRPLRDAASNSGGSVRSLAPGGPLAQAQELREASQAADVVVLHLYPYDIVPSLALAADCEATKVLLVNHSDHTFWVGAGVADSVVHLRPQSDDFLVHRRGLDPTGSSLLPIPIDEPPANLDRAKARAALGLSPETILLLTVASPFKYQAPGETSFLDLVLPVIREHPGATLLAAGPEDSGAWREACRATEGRIRALGRRTDNELLYAAADAYLDSVPFSSITSLLEAGRQGLPLVGYLPMRTGLDLLGPGAPGLCDVMYVANTGPAYRAHLSRLIQDASLRAELGRAARSRIVAVHGADGWRAELARLYARTEMTPKRDSIGTKGDVFAPSELDIALMRLFSQVQTPSRDRRLIRHCVAPLPYLSRLAVSARLRASGFDVSLLALLPPLFDGVVRGVGRRIRRSFVRAPNPARS